LVHPGLDPVLRHVSPTTLRLYLSIQLKLSRYRDHKSRNRQRYGFTHSQNPHKKYGTPIPHAQRFID
jgi:hypothetical protein